MIVSTDRKVQSNLIRTLTFECLHKAPNIDAQVQPWASPYVVDGGLYVKEMLFQVFDTVSQHYASFGFRSVRNIQFDSPAIPWMHEHLDHEKLKDETQITLFWKLHLCCMAFDFKDKALLSKEGTFELVVKNAFHLTGINFMEEFAVKESLVLVNLILDLLRVKDLEIRAWLKRILKHRNTININDNEAPPGPAVSF